MSVDFALYPSSTILWRCHSWFIISGFFGLFPAIYMLTQTPASLLFLSRRPAAWRRCDDSRTPSPSMTSTGTSLPSTRSRRHQRSLNALRVASSLDPPPLRSSRGRRTRTRCGGVHHNAVCDCSMTRRVTTEIDTHHAPALLTPARRR